MKTETETANMEMISGCYCFRLFCRYRPVSSRNSRGYILYCLLSVPYSHGFVLFESVSLYECTDIIWVVTSKACLVVKKIKHA